MPSLTVVSGVIPRRPARLLAATAFLVVAACARSAPPKSGGDRPPSASAPEWRRAPGTGDHRCVDVDRLGRVSAGQRGDSRILNVRSGQIVAGNFASLAGSGTFGNADFVAKIYWLPQRNGIAKDNALTVVVTNLTSRGSHTQRFGGPGRWAQAEGYYFWATGVRLPGHARWRLTAEAPGHWGCFTLTT